MKSFEERCAEMMREHEERTAEMHAEHEREVKELFASRRQPSTIRIHGESERISGRRPMSFDVPVVPDAHLQIQQQQAHQQHVDQHQQFVNDTMLQTHLHIHHNQF